MYKRDTVLQNYVLSFKLLKSSQVSCDLPSREYGLVVYISCVIIDTGTKNIL